MIKGMHAMIYTSDADALRQFMRDKLELPHVDVGDGWLIFDVPEADLGVHPSAGTGGHGEPAGTHAVSFYCDDIQSTISELEARGVQFSQPVEDKGYGLVTYLRAPGGLEIQLYEPSYEK